ncbi:hypothetical protein [Sarcina sp. DSM 11001]|nr:hypothetical protein [Sarcina sp. DSM 11001]
MNKIFAAQRQTLSLQELWKRRLQALAYAFLLKMAKLFKRRSA